MFTLKLLRRRNSFNVERLTVVEGLTFGGGLAIFSEGFYSLGVFVCYGET